MFTSRPIRASGPGRAAPRRSRGRWALIAVPLLALITEGCASLGIGNNGCGGGCGGRCGTGVFTGLRNRIGNCNLFRRRSTAVVESCDGGLGAAVPVEGAIVPAVPVAPGPVLSAPPPADEAGPTLQPLPSGSGSGTGTGGGSLSPPADSSSRSGTGTGVQGARTAPGRALYQTQVDRTRGEALQARREPAATASRTADPLADIPTLTAPDVPAASAAEPSSSPSPSPAPAPAAGDGPAPEKPETASFVAPAGSPAGVGPSIRRFKVIEPRLAVGSLPGQAGWSWLADLGYRTVIDLRDPSEAKPEETSAIDHVGLRRVSIPMPADRIDEAALAKLLTELSREDARPMFVFDADGRRAAIAGFLHLALTRKVDARSAEREVEELGAADSPLWKTAQTHLAKVKASEAKPVGTTTSAPTGGPAPSADSLAPTSALPETISSRANSSLPLLRDRVSLLKPLR